VRLGIDLGGTKIEIIALGDDGRELLRRRVPTPRGDYGATLQAVAALKSQEIQRWIVIPALNQVPGVASVASAGQIVKGREDEIRGVEGHLALVDEAFTARQQDGIPAGDDGQALSNSLGDGP